MQMNNLSKFSLLFPNSSDYLFLNNTPYKTFQENQRFRCISMDKFDLVLPLKLNCSSNNLIKYKDGNPEFGSIHLNI